MVSSCRISHFGAKPVKGGRPPRERRVKGAMEARIGALVQALARVVIFVEDKNLKIRNVEMVITK